MEPVLLTGTLPSTGTAWDNVSERWLAVEVSGVGSRIVDRDYKRDGYLEVGVREVWLVDLKAERIFGGTANGFRTNPTTFRIAGCTMSGRWLAKPHAV